MFDQRLRVELPDGRKTKESSPRQIKRAFRDGRLPPGSTVLFPTGTEDIETFCTFREPESTRPDSTAHDIDLSTPKCWYLTVLLLFAGISLVASFFVIVEHAALGWAWCAASLLMGTVSRWCQESLNILHDIRVTIRDQSQSD